VVLRPSLVEKLFHVTNRQHKEVIYSIQTNDMKGNRFPSYRDGSSRSNMRECPRIRGPAVFVVTRL
jgi:hypothetical protein